MNRTDVDTAGHLPGAKLKTDRMPGHWLLARLGKRVLRPGGLAMTRQLLTDLSVGPDDVVVELAPGLGLTAGMILDRAPLAYVGVERDRDAAEWVKRRLPNRANVSVRVGSADTTGLKAESATAVLGEAMLSMHSLQQKRKIMEEACRILETGGRYAIHELLIVPDGVPDEVKQEIEQTLSEAIHVAARPLTEAEWRSCMEQAGFDVVSVRQAPMSLLQPARIVADEGVFRAMRFVLNVLRDPDARRRVLLMRKTFTKYRNYLRGCAIVGVKNGSGPVSS